MRDEIIQQGKWQFNADVAQVFGDMLDRSIPLHSEMRMSCNQIALQGLPPNAAVLDVGCSTGIASSTLWAKAAAAWNPLDRVVGLDSSLEMILEAKRLHSGREDFHFLHHDLREHLPLKDESFDLVLMVLTLQFTPIEHRLRIMDEISRVLKPGGKLIFVEKILGKDNTMNEEMVACYYDYKRSMCYTEEQIEAKRLSLEGVLVPLNAEWNEHLLQSSGFSSYDCFWRWMNFAGWVAYK